MGDSEKEDQQFFSLKDIRILKKAEEARNLELLLQCQVCFEDFEEEGAYVARLLPCSHTLCHTCIDRLIQGGNIMCPECRSKHEVKKENNFPQNKYLLTHMKRKLTQEQHKVHKIQKCEEHGKELSLFCVVCNKPICRTCLKKFHRGHDITEIEDREKEALMKDVMKIKMNLEAKANTFSAAKEGIAKKTNAVVALLKKTKEEIVLCINKMINEAESLNRLENVHIDNELLVTNSNIELLSSIQQIIEEEEDMSYEGIMKQRDALVEISDTSKNLSGMRSYKYPMIFMDKSPPEYISGTIRAGEIRINLPEHKCLVQDKR